MRLTRFFALTVLMSMCMHAVGQSWPAKPLRLIVPFPPGGAGDLIGRVVGEYLSPVLGQPVVIDNRGGAAGIVAAELAAKSAPDGYTMFLTTDGTLVVNPILYDRLPYSRGDFAPVTLTAFTPMALVANPETIPVRSVNDLVALAKAKPGGLHYGSSGTGAIHHMSMELLKAAAGIDLVHVPYKGGTPALQDLLGGRIAVMFAGLSSVMPHIKSGKIVGLGIGTPKRSAMMPELPTIAEQGYPGYESSAWTGILVPKGTPGDTVVKLHQALLTVEKNTAYRDRMIAVGNEPASNTPEEFAAMIEREFQKNQKLILERGIRREP
jgi:tripartite-type tricarboxylate transporter receptor subunit TctC